MLLGIVLTKKAATATEKTATSASICRVLIGISGPKDWEKSDDRIRLEMQRRTWRSGLLLLLLLIVVLTKGTKDPPSSRWLTRLGLVVVIPKDAATSAPSPEGAGGIRSLCWLTKDALVRIYGGRRYQHQC